MLMVLRKFIILPLCIYLFVGESFATDVVPDLRVVEVLPALNDVSDIQQLSIRFNYPIVDESNLGAVLPSVPIKVSPNVSCTWRWIDESTLTCNLDKPLAYATEYEISVGPFFESLDKKSKMESAFIHKFITLRPSIAYSWIENWVSPYKPVVGLNFNQPVLAESLKKNIYFLDADSKKIQVEIGYDSSRGYNESISNGSHSERLPTNAGYSWLVSPITNLKPDANVALVVDKGIVSVLGKEPSGSIFKKGIDTFGPFKFFELQCQLNTGEEVKVTDSVKCDPEGRFDISFTAPISTKTLKDQILFYSTSESGDDKRVEDFNKLIRYDDSKFLPYDHKKGDTYNLRISGPLAADRKYKLVSVNKISFADKLRSFFDYLPASANVEGNILDVFGRVIENKIDITFDTGMLKPSFRFLDYRRASVLEKGRDSKVYVNVGGIDELILSYKRFLPNEIYENDLSVINKIPGQSKKHRFDVGFNIADLLKGQSGFVYGKITSVPPISKDSPYSMPIFVEITPYQVYAKVGKFNTLVWVVGLKDGLPIHGASVSLYKANLSVDTSLEDPISSSITDKDGLAVLPGSSTLDEDSSLNSYGGLDSKLIFVKAEHAGEVAILPAYYEFMTDTYGLLRNTSYFKKDDDSLKSWGTTAQGIYRLNDKVQYKIYIREQQVAGLLPVSGKHKYALSVLDSSGKVIHRVDDVSFSEFGSYNGEFVIPAYSVVGRASFKLTVVGTENSKNFDTEPLTFLISDFRNSSFKVVTDLTKKSFTAGDSISVKSFAELYSGGAYPYADIRISAFLKRLDFASTAHELAGFVFGKNNSSATEMPVYEHVQKLDKNGKAQLDFQVTASDFIYGDLVVESSVMDERGKYVAASKSAKYFASDVLVGLRSPKWPTVSEKQADVEYIVVDQNGKKVSNIDVELSIQKEEVLVSKVKNVHGVYEDVYTQNWINAQYCKVLSSDKVGLCSFLPKDAGSYRAMASIMGKNGIKIFTQVDFWVAGKDYVLWNTSGNDKFLEIVPEKSTFSVGENAKYFVKNPYPGANALVSIERSGVIDSFVMSFDTSSPTIEFPVKEEYLPGYYLSVVLFSPRVSEDKIAEKKALDLAEPKTKLGYIKTEVSKKTSSSEISIVSDKALYRPGEKVHMSLHVSSLAKTQPKDIELSVLVVDESVIDLLKSGINYFNPYSGFYSLGELGVSNYSLVNRINTLSGVARALKGVSDGGDGAPPTDTRMPSIDSSYVAHWTPSIHTKTGRNVAVDFDLPKTFASWKIIVSAVDKSGLMVFNTSKVVTDQDIEVREALPNAVVSGDRFDAKFTIYNRTGVRKDADINVVVESKSLKDGKISFSKHVSLEPSELHPIIFPVDLAGDGLGDVKFTVKVLVGKKVQDSLIHVVSVLQKGSFVYRSYYSSTSQNSILEKFSLPADIIPKKSSVTVSASPSVISGLQEDFKYIRDLPDDISTEVALSRAVSGVLFKSLFSKFADHISWGNIDLLPAQVIDRVLSLQSDNGGIGYFDSKYPDPYLSVYTRFVLNIFKSNGYEIPVLLSNKLNKYIEELLKFDTSFEHYDQGNKADIIAFALMVSAEDKKIHLQDLSRYQKYVQNMSLFGKAQFLKASVMLGETQAKYSTLLKNILDHQEKTLGRTVFSEKIASSYAASLGTNVRSNCAVLDSFMGLAEDPDKSSIGPLFKLVRGAMSIRGDRFLNPQELVFCSKAMGEYAKKYDGNSLMQSATMKFDNEKPTGLKSSDGSIFSGKRKFTNADLSKSHTIEITRKGAGRMYYSYMLELFGEGYANAINAGMGVKRFYSVLKDSSIETLKPGECVKRGDIVRVDLFVSVPAKRNQVVLDDFVPGGLAIINTNLATESMSTELMFKDAIDKQHVNSAGRSAAKGYGFYQEHIFGSHVKFYSTYLDPGEYHISYNAQAVATGRFHIMPSLIKEVYEHDVFGSTSESSLCVVE